MNFQWETIVFQISGIENKFIGKVDLTPNKYIIEFSIPSEKNVENFPDEILFIEARFADGRYLLIEKPKYYDQDTSFVGITTNKYYFERAFISQIQIDKHLNFKKVCFRFSNL